MSGKNVVSVRTPVYGSGRDIRGMFVGCAWVMRWLCRGIAVAFWCVFGAFLDEVIEISEIIINFVAADRIAEARSRVMREGRRKRWLAIRLAENSRADGSAMTY